MCGIVGMVGTDAATSVPAMNRLIAHRGPDDQGCYYDDDNHVALAMRRLSVLDPTHGHQPMSSRDGSTWIVYNGEVFNSPQLRQNLEAKGHSFITANSDTEVLLHLYDEKREDMLADLNGMFAFVIYDRTRSVLFGARDRIGIKPLYYLHQPSRLAFASELKAILALPGVDREINFESAFHYMSLRFVPGDSSILQGIRRLPPGHWFRYDLRKARMQIQRYWQILFHGQEQRSESEWAELVCHELKESVNRWVLSDVPVGCSLSGGLDSSSIVGLLAQTTSTPVRTYSLGFAGPGEEAWSELSVARKVAERWGTEHHELILQPADLLRDLVRMVWHLDEPYGGGLPSWYVFQFMREHVKVGLTGTGGDELFGDYGRFKQLDTCQGANTRGPLAATTQLLAKVLSPVWKWLTPLVQRFPNRLLGFRAQHKLLHWPEVREDPFRWLYFNSYYYFPDDTKRASVFDRGFLGGGVSDTSELLERTYRNSDTLAPRDAVACLAFETQLPDEFLLMTDRLSMAHALEARVPFLDHTFVELIARIPASIRTAAGDPKYLLRRAMSDYLPSDVVRGEKKGFVIPTGRWLRGPLRPLAERLLAPARLKSQGIFLPDFYKAFVAPHCEGRADYDAQVWTALMFQIWHVIFIEERLKEAPTFSWKDLC